MLKYNDYIAERMTSRLTCSMYIQDQYRRGSRGRVQGVRTPPEMTCGFLIQLLFCQTMWFIGVEVEKEKSAPPPKKKSWIRPCNRPFYSCGLGVIRVQRKSVLQSAIRASCG